MVYFHTFNKHFTYDMSTGAQHTHKINILSKLIDFQHVRFIRNVCLSHLFVPFSVQSLIESFK